jgi:hypothetical protein
VWKILLNTQQQMVVSDNAPGGAVAGDMWYNSAKGAAFVYYDNHWIEFGVQSSLSAIINLDGGVPSSLYGGTSSIDAGGST